MHAFCHMFVTVVARLMEIVENRELILGWQGGGRE
jgi:hypothetical protein